MTLAELLERRRPAIVAAWAAQAARGPGAQGLTREELLDSLPTYLDHLAALLREGQASSSQLQTTVEDHVATRLRQGYDLDDVLREYTLLGEVVARSWGESGTTLAGPEIHRFFQHLHLAMTTVIADYRTHLQDEVQSEKRDVMALERLAVGPAQDHAPGALAPLLEDALTLVTRATSAEGAALLLANLEGARLRLTAAVGPLALPGRPHATELEQDPLAARLAANPAPVTLAGPDELGRTLGPLAHSEARSWVGTRLWARGTLVGLLFVYARAPGAFQARQRRRFIALAERLASLVEHDRTRSALESLVLRLQHEQALREQFVSILAHDLRGPLAAATASAGLLVRHAARKADPRELAGRIVTSLGRADRMVRDLLDANRIRAGERLPLRLEPCHLAGLAREVLGDLAAIHGDRFDLELEEDLQGVWSTDELRRALWNLAVNAIKYGAPGGRVRVSIHREGEGAALAVHNAGPGLTREEQDRLFEPFRRSPSAQHSGQAGWGLGLTLVRGCAEAHGGRVSVDSAPGQGTTFTLHLPLDARSAAGQLPSPPPQV